MSFFQNSVLNKYIQSQDKETVQAAYKRFSAYFHSAEIQENIRNSKEEQFQEGFLRELFVNVLGYVLNPNPNYNLTTELKNEKGAKKADGAILQNGHALAVIELKGTDTKDLDKINAQAFNYKNNQRNCIYVITSNFEKLRFFIHNAVEHIEFNLFALTEAEFQLLWLCLGADSLLKGIPVKVKEDSLVVEEKITKQLYKDYSSFRSDLWQNMIKNRSDADRLLLFKKTQKLLDRFLFIFFAEDKDLLPPNSIIDIVKQWEQLKELDEYRPLYDRFKKYFGYLNTGHQGKKHEIFAYNGGLFLPDELLDSITIDDDVLHRHVVRLTSYDFQSEVDVNILGHIFENSLNEIENITAEISGQEVDKSKTKRKKDGVFYTPKYITKYIVDNTIGRLCEEKKAALEIIDEEFAKGRRNRHATTIKKLDAKLKAYREWLLNITICDPACGSGAFLNQALEFLISEHAFIDELNTQLFGGSIVFPNVGNHILEKNLFGVDINEESIEIAKLSLWLRTAEKGRKLTALNKNIKCGNSLIDDPVVAGDKAFSWEQEFPEVFARGGFDVVIGNPPYVKRQNVSDEKQILFLERNYQSATYNFDLYLLFIEKGSKLINSRGLVSYINPSKFTSTKTGSGLRAFLDKHCHITRFVDFKEFQVFEDATTYCCIFILNNNKKGLTEYFELNENAPRDINLFSKFDIYISDSASGLGWQFKPTVEIRGNQQLKHITRTFTGIESGADHLYIIGKNDPIVNDLIEYKDKIFFPILKGNNVYRYYFEKNTNYGIVPYSKEKKLLRSEDIAKNYPLVWSYLALNKESLEQREKGKMEHEGWFGYVYPKNLYKYSKNRIIWTDISIKPQFALDETKSWHVRTVCSLELNDVGEEQKIDFKYLLAILNSTLFYYYIKNNSNSVRGGYYRYKPQYVKEFPFKKVNSLKEQQPLINKVEFVMGKTHSLKEIQLQFIDLLQSSFNLPSLSKNLETWYKLDFKDFLQELKKKKIELGLSGKAEWMKYFNEQKQKAEALVSEINQIEKEIDRMVYELYGLTKEEIKVIEEA